MPHSLLPRRIEAQFAPQAQAQRAAGFGHAEHFLERAKWIRSELDHERAEGVCEGIIGNHRAQIHRI